eukprot:2313612-Pyramimonas_sp.AAC.1
MPPLELPAPRGLAPPQQAGPDLAHGAIVHRAGGVDELGEELAPPHSALRRQGPPSRGARLTFRPLAQAAGDEGCPGAWACDFLSFSSKSLRASFLVG